jgi:hypothetical protein
MTGTQSCKVCVDKPHGSWPTWFKGSHCKHCHSSWRGTAAAHALCCHLTFSSNAAVDLHRPNGHCEHPSWVLDEEKRFVFRPGPVVRADGNEYWTPLDPSERGQIAVNQTRNGPGGTEGAEGAA